MRWLPSTCFWLLLAAVPELVQSAQLVLNGGFEEGLKKWHVAGAVALETNRPLDGKLSAGLGSGPGSLTQRIETGSGNDFTVSATIQSQKPNDCVLTVRFLDSHGREVMSVDSLADMHPTKEDSRKFSHYMKAHPLTKWVEIAISKQSSAGTVLVDQVSLEMTDENAPDLRATCDLDQEMQPFWVGKTVYHEAVLMASQRGEPACGRLMFHPSRILSVQDYGLVTNYAQGMDYSLEGRTLVCSPSSRMMQMREQEIPGGELKWNSPGGKQVMVTYEHEDAWNGPHPSFLGDGLPGSMKKLKARAPLKVVAYGDSITHGVGESRLSHIPPFLPPWPELFVRRLKSIYHDDRIQLFNSAQSGAKSDWGCDYAERMVGCLDPDLVIVGFGQNDFWGVSADSFATNISKIISTVRAHNTSTEFLLVSALRFDPAYTTNSHYWNLVGDYASRLRAMTGPGVQFVDITAISEAVYAAKKPKDCLNDPLHPNDYFARWYAQSLVAALDPVSGGASSSMASTRAGANEEAGHSSGGD
jgi:lysophospholipase L1-like esterase